MTHDISTDCQNEMRQTHFCPHGIFSISMFSSPSDKRCYKNAFTRRPLPADSNIVQPSVLSVGGSKAKYRYFRVHDGFKSVRKRPDSEAERGRYCELLLADPPATVSAIKCLFYWRGLSCKYIIGF